MKKQIKRKIKSLILRTITVIMGILFLISLVVIIHPNGETSKAIISLIISGAWLGIYTKVNGYII